MWILDPAFSFDRYDPDVTRLLHGLLGPTAERAALVTCNIYARLVTASRYMSGADVCDCVDGVGIGLEPRMSSVLGVASNLVAIAGVIALSRASLP